jgi:hypothetical protein
MLYITLQICKVWGFENASFLLNLKETRKAKDLEKDSLVAEKPTLNCVAFFISKSSSSITQIKKACNVAFHSGICEEVYWEKNCLIFKHVFCL